MSDWYLLDEEPQPDGFVGGDGALESVSLRFRHKSEPATMTVYMYVVDLEERLQGEIEDDYTYDYEEMVEYAVYGSHEEIDRDYAEPIWSDYTYERPSPRSWDDEVEAEDYRDREAERWRTMGVQQFIGWNGQVPH